MKEFIIWTQNTFSDVRTEAEEFKNEYYARSYVDYLLNLAFQTDVGEAFVEIKQQFAIVDSDLEDLEKKLKLEAEERAKQDGNTRELLEEHKEVYEEYKELNEQTWNDHILDNKTAEFMTSLQLKLMEQHIFDSMENMYDDLKSIGVDLEAIENRVENLETETKDFKEQVSIQDNKNQTSFEDNNKKHKEVNKKFEEVEKKLDDADKRFDELQEYTEENFEIAEQGLVELKEFCNTLDSKVMTDDVITRACFHDHDVRIDMIESATVTEMAVLQQEMKLTTDKMKEGFDKDIKQMEKRIVEDTIPGQVLRINESLEEIRNAQKDNLKNTTDEMEKKIKENGEKIESLESTMESLEDRVEQAEVDV